MPSKVIVPGKVLFSNNQLIFFLFLNEKYVVGTH